MGYDETIESRMNDLVYLWISTRLLSVSGYHRFILDHRLHDHVHIILQSHNMSILPKIIYGKTSLVIIIVVFFIFALFRRFRRNLC